MSDLNPKALVGRNKPQMHAVPPEVLLLLGKALADGEVKYGRFNWRTKPIVISDYYDAMWRHLVAWYGGEDVAPDSGTHHLAHIMASCAILLDAEAHKALQDDRWKAPTALNSEGGE